MSKFLSFLVVLLLLVTSAVVWMTKEGPDVAPSAQNESSGQGEALIGGDFTLTDTGGKTVSDRDFRGKVMLVFFGFTHCPDICPVSTASLSALMGMLGDKADQVAPIFITVDPERDTPEVMKNYLANFDKRMVGLTGSAEQIQQAANAYKVYYSKATSDGQKEELEDSQAGDDENTTDMAEEDAMDEHGDHDQQAAAQDGASPHEHMHEHGHEHGGEYTIDHSGFIYLMGKDGKYLKHFPYDAPPAEMAEAVKPYLQ